MERIEFIFEEKKIRNAEWIYALLKTGKYGLFMNGRLQRIFSDGNEARTMFEIYTSRS